MNPSASDEPEASPLAEAVERFSAALDHLIDQVDSGALGGLDANGLVGFLQAYETIRKDPGHRSRRHPDGHRSGRAAHALCQRTMTRVLTQSLRLSAADAGRRVRAAAQLGDRRVMTGPSLAPLLTALRGRPAAGRDHT